VIETDNEYDRTVRPGEEDEETPNDEEYDSDVIIVKSLQHVGKVTRSFTAIPDKLQRLCYVVKEWVADYTLFNNPFLSSLDILNLIHEAWERAEDKENNYQERTKACDTLVGCWIGTLNVR